MPHIYDKVMMVQRGARPGVPKAAVVVTGGRGQRMWPSLPRS